MRYFLDNCICPKFAPMLRALDVDIVALRDQLPANSTDVDVFNYLAGSDFIWVSEDRRQLTRIAEATVLKASGISALYFGPFWSDLGFWKQAKYLITFWQDWDGVFRGLEKGAIMEAKQRGKLMSMS